MGRKLERDFQPIVIDELRERLPGCIVVKLDTDFLQGSPDLCVLWHSRWALLEVKKQKPTRASDFQPGQEYYVDLFNEWSFAAVVYPENKKEVLDALERSLKSRRSARVS